jgi:hypothetical protein
MWILYFPVLLYAIYLAAKARSWGFFSAVNPGMPSSGLFRDSKYDTLQLFPTKYIPVSECVLPNTTPRLSLQNHNPLILKPDIGDRGYGVECVKTEQALKAYFKQYGDKTVLVQEYIDYECEVGVFYYRYPNTHKGTIPSLTLKEFLHVVGNGKDTLKQLILAKPRAVLQYKELQKRYQNDFDTIIPNNQSYNLGIIGNHSRGTMFINANHLIDDALLTVFDQIFEECKEQIYYGRYDIRCKSLEDLKQGKHFKILEFNGVAAEPTHIYDPKFKLIDAYRTLFRHWNIIYEIAMQNKIRGKRFVTFKEVWYMFQHNSY